MRGCYIIYLLLYAAFALSQTSKGLSAKYSFNQGEIKNDLDGSRPKAYNVDLAEDRFGNEDRAVYLRGNTRSFINLGTSNNLKPKQGSISLWVNIYVIMAQGQGVTYNPIISTRANNYDDCCEAYCVTFEITKPFRFGMGASDSCNKSVSIISPLKVITGEWYHLVMTYNDSSLCFYQDGVLQHCEKKGFQGRFLDGDSVLVGYFNNGKNIRFLRGYVDDIRIYNRVLSADEVYELYNEPNPNKTAVYIKWILIVLNIIVFIILIIWFINYRVRKSLAAEREKNRLNARMIELETRAIRSQMNPHFIFNSMNALQRFILEDNKLKAYGYLIEFSTLLRKLLESSEAETIALQEEMEMLEAYLKVEEMRFDNSFTYEITSSVNSTENIQLPIMLVQPFAENAIWHGLLNKQGERILKIHFSDLNEKQLLCEIDDNGVGRKNNLLREGVAKRKSLAIDFTKQRLHLIAQATGIPASLEIIDKKDDAGNSLGTTVKLIIPKMK